MTPAPDPRSLTDAERFDLFLRPEAWPEDPEAQAELAELLELHLALAAHAPKLAPELQPPSRVSDFGRAWLPAAAAALLTLLPLGYALHRIGSARSEAQSRVRLQTEAQRRGQDRLWAAFFQQSCDLLRQFERNPPACEQPGDPTENRNTERELASALLDASRQLAAQDSAPLPEAEYIRTNLHAWLTELSLEDGCMAPQRVKELQQYASTHKLEDETERLGRLLKERDS